MKKVEIYTISEDNALKLKEWASNIYNTILVLDYFCSTQTQYSELNNISPIIQNLRKDADYLYAYFINLSGNK